MRDALRLFEQLGIIYIPFRRGRAIRSKIESELAEDVGPAIAVIIAREI